MNKDGVVYYLHADHLGSTSLATNESGQEVTGSRTLYYPYGEQRWSASGGTLPTDYTFTGQRKDAGIGLMDYNARFYDPYINRWISPDTIVPDFANPQSLNRYSYVYNRPLVYIDQDGHIPIIPLIGLVAAGVALVTLTSDVAPPPDSPVAQARRGNQVVGGYALVIAATCGAGTLAAPTASGATATAVAAELLTAELADGDSDELQALEAARRLTEVGLESNEAKSLIRTITDASTRGPTTGNGATVLGHYPAYVDKAQEMGATYLDTSPEVWEALGSTELRWAVNQQFIDDAVARGDTFVFASVLQKADSYFAWELEYLSSLISGNPTIHPQP
jgi:RHS repeat-associated protein